MQTERLRESSTRRLVCWVHRDEKTRAIRWSLEVLRTQLEPAKLPRDEYVKAIARELANASRFQVESTALDKIAGKPAMHFRGTWQGALKLWRRQTWVEVKPAEYLVLNIAGPITDKAAMDKVLTAVAGTLKLFDPSAVLAERSQNLSRGSAVLGALTRAKLEAVLTGEPSYFLLRLKGKTIGFVRITEAIVRRDKDQGPLGTPKGGLSVGRIGALKPPGEPRRLTREELFATVDRNVERWRRIVVDGEGTSAVRSVSEGIKQEDLLLVNTIRSGRPTPSRQRRLPAKLAPAYLPAAFDVILPRMIDRTKPAAYGFVVYGAAANDFDLRILRVVGAESITHAGRGVAAVRLTDRMAPDAPSADLWVDEKGLLLMMRTADGLTMERVRQKAVSGIFAAELRQLASMGS